MSDDIAARARRRTALVVAAASAIVLVAVAIGAAVILLLPHRDRASAPESAPATTPSTADPPPATALPATPQASTPQAPADLGWATVAGARLPVSRTAGPYDTVGGRAWGFAHNRLGAVLAAAHLSLRLCPQVGPDVFGATLREQVVGGDAAALGQQLEDDYEQARAQLGLPYGQPAGRLYSVARGYRVDSDSPTTATVRLLIEGPGKAGASVLVELRLHTQWLGEDWVLVAPPGGSWDSVTALVTDTTGYTRFPDGA